MIQNNKVDIHSQEENKKYFYSDNINSDPLFAAPSRWDNNNTPEDANDDFWIEGDYHLKSQASKSYFDKPLCNTIVAGDINGDCKVDEADMEILMLHWLE